MSDVPAFADRLSPRLRERWQALGNPARPTARQLWLLTRRLRGGPIADDVRILSVTPSRVAWGETLVVKAQYPEEQRCTFLLRTGDRVFRIPARSVKQDVLEGDVPGAPSDVASTVRAQLFLSTGTGSTAPVTLEIMTGPVLRGASQLGRQKWRLIGAGFGSDPDMVQLLIPGNRSYRISDVTPNEIRFTAALSARTPLRVFVEGRKSNAIQVRVERHERPV